MIAGALAPDGQDPCSPARASTGAGPTWSAAAASPDLQLVRPFPALSVEDNVASVGCFIATMSSWRAGASHEVLWHLDLFDKRHQLPRR